MGIDPSNVPQWGRVVLTLDGGVPQMKATMDPKSLDEKVKRLKIQVKIAKNTSGVFQPCDVGNGHVCLGHWVRRLGPDDVPHLGIVQNATAALQCLRDKGMLVITAEKMSNMTHCTARLPTVL